MPRRKLADVSRRELLLVLIPVLLAVALIAWVGMRYVKPAPPKQLTITAGPADGAYYAFAQEYKKRLTKFGVTLDVLTSSGSVENLARLQDINHPAQVGFVQGGVGASEVATRMAEAHEGGNSAPSGKAKLVSLGALYYEPLWVFMRGNRGATALPDQFAALQGTRIAIGPEGSGTRKLALQLLAASGVNSANASLLDLGGIKAVDALEMNQVDVAFVIGAVESPVVQRLLRSREAQLMSLAQAGGITRQFPFLTPVSLPQGTIDLAANIPSRDVTLIAATANLVSMDDMHPALMYLFLDITKEMHKGASRLNEAGMFPNLKGQEFDLAEETERYFKTGKPFLQRYLPYWLANLIDRLSVLLVPILAVLVPAIKLIPDALAWRVKLRINKWYAELRGIEETLMSEPAPEKVTEYLRQLDAIETQINNAEISKWYSTDLYSLRSAIDLVRERLGQPGAKAIHPLRSAPI